MPYRLYVNGAFKNNKQLSIIGWQIAAMAMFLRENIFQLYAQQIFVILFINITRPNAVKLHTKCKVVNKQNCHYDGGAIERV